MVEHLFASIPVVDRDAAAGWYERLLGRPADLIPNEIEAAWRLTRTAWIYLIEEPARAGSSLHTVLVDDLDAMLSDMAARGIEAGPVERIGAGGRFVLVTDPDGNRLKVARPEQQARSSARP